MQLRRFLWLCLIPIVVVSVRSQTAAPDSHSVATIQAKVRLVVVNVVVTNHKGEPVSGLHKEDFTVFEDGKPQTVGTFEEHQGGQLTPAKQAPLPPHVYANYPLAQTGSLVNVLLLDALNTPTQDQVFVRKQMLKYLASIPPGTRVAIFTLASGLRMIQGVTSDSSELRAALNDKKLAANAHQSGLLPTNTETDSNKKLLESLRLENPSGQSDSPEDSTDPHKEVDPFYSMQDFLADANAAIAQSRVEITLQALQQLARYLSDVPGRKNVIWFSGSFPTGILPNEDLLDPTGTVKDFTAEIRKTTDLLASSQVAIYPIAAEGLAPDAAFDADGSAILQRRLSQSINIGKDIRDGAEQRESGHAAMEELAKDTGGQAFYNTNGLSDALARVIDNGSHFYTLTYTPANKDMNGKFRHIRVELPKGDYKVAYGHGYFGENAAVTAKQRRSERDPLFAMMGRNLPNYSQLLFKIRVLPASPQPPQGAPHIGGNSNLKGPITRYGVDFAVAAQDLKFDLAPDGVRHGNLEVMLIAYDRQGKALNSASTGGAFVVQPKDYANLLEVGVHFHQDIDVPNGYTFLRTGIYDANADIVGTLGVPLRDEAAPPASAAK